METFSWLTLHTTTSMATISMEAELRCATMEPTVQCVMMDGQTTMLQSCAQTWVTLLHSTVSLITMILMRQLAAIALDIRPSQLQMANKRSKAYLSSKLPI